MGHFWQRTSCFTSSLHLSMICPRSFSAIVREWAAWLPNFPSQEAAGLPCVPVGIGQRRWLGGCKPGSSGTMYSCFNKWTLPSGVNAPPWKSWWEIGRFGAGTWTSCSFSTHQGIFLGDVHLSDLTSPSPSSKQPNKRSKAFLALSAQGPHSYSDQ